ncbi:transcriptional regulator, AraC family [Kribbella flavida DSM 17836]|uniref:Transcriptional regulator, AraC family n=1 Tax=Kribbella flavida (strain DSM 17836 / JCM 10339 / NBRC 14399) TaxID=479435 RepID=D2PR29_KRIFD|nr:AraC family transcriptional regulator [Kribbella flavida]ADB32977.1 transcriptional regulator, AraC family [Kribbella flavida DSM 17836]
MDVFSDVIASARVGLPKFTRSQRVGRWGNRFGPYPGAGFHVVLQGACWLIPPSGEPVALGAGDVVFLPHGVQHGMSDSPDRKVAELPPDPGVDLVGEFDEAPDQALLLCGAYRLDRGLAHPFLRSLPEVVHLPTHPGRRSGLDAAVELLRADLAENRPGAEAAQPALLDLLLVYLLREWLDSEPGKSETGWGAALTDPAITAALHHIHREPGRQWTVQELAHEAGLSRTVFARRFSALVGQPPLTYLTWWRLSTAAQLLRSGDAPLASIARQVGYTSEFAFAAAFKREFGLAPGAYRRQAPDRPAAQLAAEG